MKTSAVAISAVTHDDRSRLTIGATLLALVILGASGIAMLNGQFPGLS